MPDGYYHNCKVCNHRNSETNQRVKILGKYYIACKICRLREYLYHIKVCRLCYVNDIEGTKKTLNDLKKEGNWR